MTFPVWSEVLDITIQRYASFAMNLQLVDSASNPISIVSWSFSASVKHAYNQTPSLTTFSISNVDLTQSRLTISLHPLQTSI
jgi:hypothetical protein